MRFDDNIPRAKRLDKYIYYGEKIVTRAIIAAMIVGFIVFFWEGWVQGSSAYQKAMRTVGICKNNTSIMESDHLRQGCDAASDITATYPVIYAARFVLVSTVEWIIATICHIGASWLTSSLMGIAFTIMAAYVYRRVCGPPNTYAMMCCAIAEEARRGNFGGYNERLWITRNDIAAIEASTPSYGSDDITSSLFMENLKRSNSSAHEQQRVPMMASRNSQQHSHHWPEITEMPSSPLTSKNISKKYA